MRKMLMLVVAVLLVTVGMAYADKPPQEFYQRVMEPCGFQTITYNWDFAQGDQGFVPTVCDPDGLPVWEYGATTYVPDAPPYVWGTILNADYLNNAGHGLVSPSFMVDASTAYVEVDHYYDIETNYDGCNLKVNGNVVAPLAGYDGTISTSTSYFAYCVDMQEGFTGHDNMWRTDCWDLTAFEGEMVELEFDLGSDSIVDYPGWYLAAVRVGGIVVDNEQTSWGLIKGMYK